MKYAGDRCGNMKRQVFGDIMVDVNEFDFEVCAKLDDVPIVHDGNIHGGKVRELLVPLHDDTPGETRTVYGRIAELGKNVRQGADVIVVSVGYHESADTVYLIGEVADVG